MSHESSREAYAREHGLSADNMRLHVGQRRMDAFWHSMWGPEPTRMMGEGFSIDFEFTLYGRQFIMDGVKTCRTPCSKVPGALCHVCHEPTEYPYDGTDVYHVECFKARWAKCPLCQLPIAASGPEYLMPIHRGCATKHLKSKLKYTPPLPDHGRDFRELTTYEEVQAALLQGYTVQLSSRKRTLPPTSYFYERAMARSQELKQGIDTEGFTSETLVHRHRNSSHRSRRHASPSQLVPTGTPLG